MLSPPFLTRKGLCTKTTGIVGNQHKRDRLGPEKIIIMKSCVGAP